jgi:hypothetical protein
MTKMRCILVFLFVLIYAPGVMADGVDLPWTGQTKCYDSAGKNTFSCTGTGQDGEFRAGVAWPNPRFLQGTGTQADCITDKVTGLMWAKMDSLVAQSGWGDAVNFADNLTLCGYTDWRLPNINELESLVNADAQDIGLWLRTRGFRRVLSGYHWSSTSCGAAGQAYGVGLATGDIIQVAWDTSLSVLPVRGGQAGSVGPAALWKTGQAVSYLPGDDGALQMGVAWPTPRFTDEGDGTVMDGLTGLVWSRDASTPGPLEQCRSLTPKTWQEALYYVRCLNGNAYLGYTDWRLPNRKELMSLIDRSQLNPALPQDNPFINVETAGFYWTSTSWANGPANGASGIDMGDGSLNIYDKSSATGYVWPVRPGTPCTYAISPTSKSFPTNGGSATVNVTATGEGCPAPPITNLYPSWVGAAVSSWKNNKGTVKIVVMATTSSYPRNGAIGIGEATYNIAQSGVSCAIKKLVLKPQSYSAAGGSGILSVQVSPQDCGWTVLPSTGWIYVTPGSGTGNGTVSASIDVNPTGKSRSGKVTVTVTSLPNKKATVTVSQSAK